MIFYWLIDHVSVHKTPSPILWQADRAVTHEYSLRLRQEVIYHPHWASLEWLKASEDSTQRKGTAHVLTHNKMCLLRLKKNVLRKKLYLQKHAVHTKFLSILVHKSHFIFYMITPEGLLLHLLHSKIKSTNAWKWSLTLRLTHTFRLTQQWSL